MSPKRRRLVSQSELAIAREKVLRANRHFEVVQRVIRSYVRRDCGIKTQFNRRTNEFDVVARLPPPPNTIGLLVADAVHNLRTALDHIVYALIQTNPNRPPGTPNEKTMFPIRDTKEGYIHQKEKLQRLKGLPDQAAAVVEALQPFKSREKGEDHTLHHLWVLDRLENIDKHRRLNLVAGVGLGSHVSIRYKSGHESDVLLMQDVIYDRAVLASYPPALDGSEVQVSGYLMVYVALQDAAEMPSLLDEDICRILRQLVEFVGNDVMGRFARLATFQRPTTRRPRRQDKRMLAGRKGLRGL